MTGQTGRKPSIPAHTQKRTAATHASRALTLSYRHLVRLQKVTDTAP